MENNVNVLGLNALEATNNVLVLSEEPRTILISFDNIISIYEIKNENTFTKKHSFAYTDSILQVISYNKDKNEFLLAGKTNKKIELCTIEQNLSIKFSYTHQKKLTSILLLSEGEDKFLLFSDKFGEISIKKSTPDETAESFVVKAKIISGHCDPITFLQLSNNEKLLLSSDSFGKIKIYKFPNMFNVLSVLLYPNDGILYCNFIGKEDESVVVVTNTNEINLWSMYDFKMQMKKVIDIEQNDKVQFVLVDKAQCECLIETKNEIRVYDINTIKFDINLTKTIKKEESDKSLTGKIIQFSNDKYYYLFDKENNLTKIIKI